MQAGFANPPGKQRAFEHETVCDTRTPCWQRVRVFPVSPAIAYYMPEERRNS